MGTKPNYFKVGLFVVVAMALVVIVTVVWGAGLFNQDKIYFETYFDTNVTGLDIGAPVELRGVMIGKVERIEFAGSVYDTKKVSGGAAEDAYYVRVLCSMDRGTAQNGVGDVTGEQRDIYTENLIERGLRLRLASNILTGQAFLDGTFVDPERFEPLEFSWEPHYTYIPSAPGEFSTMKDSVDRILFKLEEIDVEAITGNINNLLMELRQILKKTDASGETVSLAQILQRLDNILEKVDRKVADKSTDIDRIMKNLREVSDDLKELTTRLKDRPSELLFTKPPTKTEMTK